MIKHKFFTLLVALCATTALWASSTITYAATEKLTGNKLDIGATTFGPAITSHTFANGIGTITCDGEVTTIGEWAFFDCAGLTSVTIPNSVTTIGYGAFRECTGLTSVTIPNSVTTIGYGAFRECTGLTSVTIPNSVTTIGGGAFANCRSLTSIDVDAANTHYASVDGVLFNYTKDTLIQYPASNSRTEYIIPNSVTTIGERAFYKCSGLTSVTIPNSVTTIGRSAFSNCSGLTSVTIPNSVTTIGEYAFYECSGLTSVTIPNSVTTIGSSAFRSCHSLTSITIPNSVTTIGEYAFYWCKGLTSISVDAANTHYASIDGVLFNYAKDTLIQYPIGNPRAEYIIPNSVTTIGYGAFYCSSLTSITIPNSVTTIGNWAFSGCSGLTSVTIPNSVTTIGERAFDGCSGLTSITIGNSVTSIGNEAFVYCSALTSITCEATTPPTCGSYCFYDVDKSIPLYVPAGSVEAYQAADEWKDFTDIQPIIDETCIITYTATEKLEETTDTWSAGLHTNAFDVSISSHTFSNGVGTVTFAGEVTTIGNNAFYNCKGLTSVTIPNSVTTIGSYAFYNCKGLTSVTIGNSVTTIGSSAFRECSGLTSITIGNSVTTIGEYAFYNCSGLTSITIPNSVTSIGNYAFEYCRSLTSIDVDAANTHYASVDGVLFNYTKDILIQYPIGNTRTEYTIPNSVTTIGEKAFLCCNNLTSITIPNSVKTIGGGAFEDCNSLTSITIGNSVTTIGEGAFRGCTSLPIVDNIRYADTYLIEAVDKSLSTYTIKEGVKWIGDYAFSYCNSLTSVAIPNSVTTIGKYAFGWCSGLTSVTCEATTPPTCGNECFYKVDQSIPLYVPAGSVEAYQAADEWKDFYDIRPIATAKDVEVTEIEAEPTESAVEIAWPSVVNAETYTIEIRLGDQLICSIVFNAQGQLVSINFNLAPGRGGHTYATTAEDTATGWAYTIAGLNPGTKYTYSVIAKNADEQVIDTKSGSFTTQGLPTSIDNMGNNFNNSYVNPTKSLRNGQVIIRKNNKTYNVVGQEVK